MGTSGRIWPNFEPIQALIHVLITCKYEKDPIKISGENVMISFSPLKVYGIFFIRSRVANPAVLGPIWPNFELVRDVIDVLVTSKYGEDPIKNEGARVLTTFSPLLHYGSYPLPWTPEFQSDLAQNLIHLSPLPNDASDKIWLRSAHGSQRYSCLNVWTHIHTYTHTDAGSTGIL